MLSPVCWLGWLECATAGASGCCLWIVWVPWDNLQFVVAKYVSGGI